MKIKGGYTNYGQDIGILMLDTVFPRIPGDVGNAKTFPFPVKYHIVKNPFLGKKLPQDANTILLDTFIEAAKQLEAQGCKAITTSCGFLAGFQSQLAQAVNIPVFTSILTLVPMISTIIGKNKKIGIFTERSEFMNEFLFQKTGWSSNEIPVCISSLPEDSEFAKLIIYDQMEGDMEALKDCIRTLTEEHIKQYPDTGAILLECQNFSPFGDLIQEISGVPVFGINQFIAFIESCINYKSY